MNAHEAKFQNGKTFSIFKKTAISLFLGIAGFFGAFYSINFTSEHFSISIVWSTVFPLIAAMAYGEKFGFLAGSLGLGAMFPFFIWSNNGWASFVSFTGYLLFFVWHGYFARLRINNRALWNDPLVIQLPYACIYAIMILFLYPWAFSLNPPSWAPGALNSISPQVLNGIALKSALVMCIVTIFSAFILILPQIRGLLGLPIKNCSRKNGHIFIATLSATLSVWFLMLIFNSIFVENDFLLSTFTISSPFEIIGFVVILSAGLASGYTICLIFEKRYMAEEKLIESEETLRTTFEHILDGVLVVNVQAGKFILANNAICAMTGYSLEEVISLGINEIHPAASLDYVKDKFERQMKGEITLAPDVAVLRKDGSIFFADINSTSLHLNGQHCVLGVFHDITERRKAQEELKASLKEKEILLRELYHRTKNNMQVITSMLALQAKADDNEKVKRVFKDTTAKIKAMSLVHQKLYQSQELSNINLGEYTSDLVRLFLQIYEEKDRQIKVNENFENISALIDIAAPFGLIFSELFTNSLKHAFLNVSEAVIDLTLSKDAQGFIKLQYCDNGPGFAKDFTPREKSGLGLKTIMTLAEHQLQGTIDFDSVNGFKCTIKFLDNLYKPRV